MESKTDSAIRILIDHNIEGWGTLLWNTLMTEGWADLYQIEMLMFADVGLDYDSNDREVWRFAQINGIIREKCAERLLEVMLYPKNYLGIARLFIP